MELYGHTYHCWKKKGHGYMSLSNAIKQSCDTYFYEVARLLGVDRLNETAKKFGLGNRVLENNFFEEKKGLVPSTKWKKEAHHLLILHGRYVCKARKPDCEHCVIVRECEYPDKLVS